jgi:hypothetical protein
MSSIWSDPDFRQLEMAPQWLYLRLLSSQHRNLIGLVPFTPRAWQASVTRVHLDVIGKALDELAAVRFVLIDEATDELLIRSSVKHDPPRNPSATLGMWRQWAQIESLELRRAVIVEIPARVWLSNPESIPPDAHRIAGHSHD